MWVVIIILCILGGLLYLAIKGFKFAFDDSHGCLIRIIVFAIACAIVFSIFGQ